MGRTAQDLINVIRGWIGFSEGNGKYRQIIDLYNSHRPLARGYRVKYSDEWCDTTVSAAAIKAGMTDIIGTECGCEEHVKIFKAKGIWIEDGTITPKPGYTLVTGTVKEMLQYYYENITHDFRCDSLTFTPCIC